MSATLAKAEADSEMAKGPQASEVSVSETIGERRLPGLGESLEEPPPPTDTAALIPEEHLSVTTETIIEIIPLTELPIQTSEAGPSRTMISSVTVTISESLQIPLSESEDVATTLSMALKLLVLNSVSIFVLRVASLVLGVTAPRAASQGPQWQP